MSVNRKEHMPNTKKPGRVTRSLSLTEGHDERLDKEAEKRLLSPAKLVEMGLNLLFAKMDATPAEEEI